eukprot:gene21983-24924_t
MSEIDLIKGKIAITEADLAEAKKEKDFARRDRLEALLTEQTAVWKNLLASQASAAQPVPVPTASDKDNNKLLIELLKNQEKMMSS